VLAAYQHCEQVVRSSGSSFAAAFWMFSRPRRRALHAIYAFCRLADDIADDPEVSGDRHRLLERWREELRSAYRGKALHPVGLALGDAARRFQLPEEIFLDLLRGIESDLKGEAIETFDDLCRYCYRVASTVGLLIVQVLGCHHPRTRDYAVALGIAVQLTNVLRDVGQDASAGRIYLPRQDLERMDVDPGSLSGERESEELRLLMALYAERARIFYERAARLLPERDRRALRPAEAMGRIYRVLLEELRRRGFPCTQEPVRLSSSRRLAIAASVWLGVEDRRSLREAGTHPSASAGAAG
jgi:phytoene synthase